MILLEEDQNGWVPQSFYDELVHSGFSHPYYTAVQSFLHDNYVICKNMRLVYSDAV